MSDLTRPIIGIERRSAPEVFDIMCDRFRASQAEIERLRDALNKIVNNWTDLHPKDLAQARRALSGSKD